MRTKLPLLMVLTAASLFGEHTIAVIGLVHSHVWGHLGKMVSGQPAKLVGVAETEPELVAEAKKRGVPADLIFSDYSKMLDEKKPEIVWAFVENNRHLEIAKACAARKINVMFEKPLAATFADAKAIRDLAGKSGIYVLTNYQMAWWPSNYEAKKVADSGALGQVFRLHGVVGHGGPGAPTGTNKYFLNWLTDPEKNGAGALMDFGCYNALWSLWYLGRPERVWAQVNQLRPQDFPKVEDNATLILSYKNGVGLFEGSWDLPRSFQDLEVFGRQASMMVKNGLVEVKKGRAEAEKMPIEPLPAGENEPIAYMIHCLETKTPPGGLVAIDINVGVVEIIEAAKHSLATGQAVPLPK